MNWTASSNELPAWAGGGAIGPASLIAYFHAIRGASAPAPLEPALPGWLDKDGHVLSYSKGDYVATYRAVLPLG